MLHHTQGRGGFKLHSRGFPEGTEQQGTGSVVWIDFCHLHCDSIAALYSCMPPGGRGSFAATGEWEGSARHWRCTLFAAAFGGQS